MTARGKIHLGLATLVGVAGGLMATAATAAPPGGGEAVFVQRCASCHALQPTTPKMGPALAGVVGRKAGATPGYAYGEGMKTAGFVWTEARLDAFLTAPAAAVPGTRMMVKLADAGQRTAVIAYLASLSPKPTAKRAHRRK